ncbi:phage major capsid protein [Lacticaseibacillus suibinensis]|uniref:phage major capsid protein n=1 Tax=Lacticaseibacillus suibinensis TaxID=2486011 RepID=UPI000F771F27|nr:phage major capsid protein [Lacticaseibacillus suibinensis]
MALKRETFNPDNTMMREAPDGTVPAKFQALILKDVVENSKLMQLARFEQMDDLSKSFEVFAKGPGAYWVDEGNRIQTSKAEYVPVTMQAHKLAVILLASREYLNYKQSAFFTEMQPKIAEAFYRKFDEAGILNVDNPYKFSLAQSATAAGNEVVDDISFNSLLKVEDVLIDHDIEANAWVNKAQNNTLLRNATKVENGTTERLYDRSGSNIDGIPFVNLKSDSMKKGELFAGDFDYAFYGIPGNIQYKISEDAQLSTIVAADGKPVNLFEQDLFALRATMDVAFMIVKDEAFAHLSPKA